MRLLRRRVAEVHLSAENDRSGDTPGELAVAGAHGGAGTSTLAALLRPAWDVGTVGDLLHGRLPGRIKGQPLVVATRNTVAAARHATNAVTALHEQGVLIAALAIVADGAGPEPRDASARFSLLESRVGGVVRIPFVPMLRLVDNANGLALPGRVEDALTALCQLADGPTQGSASPPSGRTTRNGPLRRWAVNHD